MPKRTNGWTAYPHTGNWVVKTSEINSGDNSPGWTCYKFTGTRTTVVAQTTLIDDTFTNLKEGVCVNKSGGSPANYSRGGMSRAGCEATCISLPLSGTPRCVGYSHNTSINRCALWLDTALTSIPKRQNWDIFAAINWTVGTDEISKGDKSKGWNCWARYIPPPAVVTTTTAVTTMRPFTLADDCTKVPVHEQCFCLNQRTTLARNKWNPLNSQVGSFLSFLSTHQTNFNNVKKQVDAKLNPTTTTITTTTAASG